MLGRVSRVFATNPKRQDCWLHLTLLNDSLSAKWDGPAGPGQRAWKATGYKVTNGRYQGTTKAVGYDGLWASPEGHAIVAEVKTTDAYRISLDNLANYRDRLRADGDIPATSSILLIVGREDTGELEAQVRGSRHAWDMRLIIHDCKGCRSRYN